MHSHIKSATITLGKAWGALGGGTVMSSSLRYIRWTAGFALLVIVGNCGQPTQQLNFQSVSEPASTDFIGAVPMSPDSVPTPSYSVNTETTVTSQIAAEFVRLLDLRVQCGLLPASCPITQMTTPNSTYRRYLEELMKIRVAANLVTRVGAGRFRFRIDSVKLVSSIEAVVHTCIFDSLVVFDSGRLASVGDDIVFDDDVISGHTRWRVVSHDGKWKWSDATSIDTTYGRDICEFVS